MRIWECRKCGKAMQATAIAYLSTDGRDLLLNNIVIDETTWYCEDDHQADTAHTKELKQAYREADAFGKPAGWRSPGVQIAQARDANNHLMRSN